MTTGTRFGRAKFMECSNLSQREKIHKLNINDYKRAIVYVIEPWLLR